MMFNNKFNKDNKIKFVLSEWICTDPDEVQFCRPISENEFEYIQIKNPQIKSVVKGGCNALAALDGETQITDWYQDEIDVRDYSDKEIEDYVSPYGDILEGSKGANRNQLIAECIFEQDIVFSGDYDN